MSPSCPGRPALALPQRAAQLQLVAAMWSRWRRNWAPKEWHLQLEQVVVLSWKVRPRPLAGQTAEPWHDWQPAGELLGWAAARQSGGPLNGMWRAVELARGPEASIDGEAKQQMQPA